MYSTGISEEPDAAMRTTLNLDEELLARAHELTGIRERTMLLHEGLRLLIQREERDGSRVSAAPCRRWPRRDVASPRSAAADPRRHLRLGRPPASW